MLAGVKLLFAGDYDEFAALFSLVPHVFVVGWLLAADFLRSVEGPRRPANLSNLSNLSNLHCQQPDPGTSRGDVGERGKLFHSFRL